jgi:2-C-methyl-D-erythritol 4-phosphate cytidylyltransferase
LEKYTLIVAGGKGKRMSNSIPKQFLPLKGKAILLHSLERFQTAFPDIHFVLVLPKEHIAEWKQLAMNTAFENIEIAEGGAERTESVQAGLNLIPTACIVGIHDAVRPLVSIATIKKTYELAEKVGNAIPVISLNDSIRRVGNKGSQAVDRNLYKIVQTPQCFRSSDIKSAYQKIGDSLFTDDASVLEATAKEIHLVEGNRENIKITNPSDLTIAEALLAQLDQ